MHCLFRHKLIQIFTLILLSVLISPFGHTQNNVPPDFVSLAEKASPAVVNIRTIEKVTVNRFGFQGDDMQEFFRRFFGAPTPKTPRSAPRNQAPTEPEEREIPGGLGSGFIIASDGYILTNAHVVLDADEVYVTLSDKREFKAKIIGLDKRTDVALVKIETNNLPRLPIGDINRLKVGEWVMAIGSPFGLDNTVTAGIVSAKGRDTGSYLPFIQTDVAVNPGNSGGPLLNMRGEVVGINSQIYSRSGGFMGISFAIPIDEAMRVSEQLKATGKVVRSRIGVVIGEVSREISESLGLSRSQGALVNKVEANGPADRAGIEAGDIVLRFNDIAIEKTSDLPRLVGETKPGSKINLSIWRKGQTRQLSVVVTALEEDSPRKISGNEATPQTNILGLIVSDLSEQQKQALKLTGGVVVDAANGTAARAGIRADDIILAVGNTAITNAKQFNVILEKIDRKRSLALLIRRGDSAQFIAVRPGN